MTVPAANGKPLRVSWSKLKEWEDCNAKGYLKAQGKQAEIRDSRTFFPGTVADRCMRAWLDAPEQAPGAMAAMVDEIMDREEVIGKETGDGVPRWRGPRDRRESADWVRDCVSRLEPILLEHVVPFEYQTALRFSVPIAVPHPDGTQHQIHLTGEMDLLVRALDHSWTRVKDLKATRSDDYWRSTYPQLIFYELAAWVLTQQWPEQSWLIQPMCTQPWLSFTFTVEHHREMLGRIVRWAEGQWAGSNRPKASNHWCTDCVVMHACPKFTSPGRRVLVKAY